MIVDSSALLAILFAEPDRERYAVALDAAPSVRLSAVNFVEAAVRVDMGHSPIASDAFDDLIREARVYRDGDGRAGPSRPPGLPHLRPRETARPA